MKINVRNLSTKTSCLELIDCFREFGVVTDARVSRFTVDGKFRALGFVEMPFHLQGQSAIDSLKDRDIGGNILNLQED